jgi:integrase
MFNLAVEDKKLDRNDVPHFPMLREARQRSGYFETSEYEALSRALPPYLRLPLALGFYTGMREGEILGLEWEQVDLLNNIIVLRQGETKTMRGARFHLYRRCAP